MHFLLLDIGVLVWEFLDLLLMFYLFSKVAGLLTLVAVQIFARWGDESCFCFPDDATLISWSSRAVICVGGGVLVVTFTFTRTSTEGLCESRALDAWPSSLLVFYALAHCYSSSIVHLPGSSLSCVCPPIPVTFLPTALVHTHFDFVISPCLPHFLQGHPCSPCALTIIASDQDGNSISGILK